MGTIVCRDCQRHRQNIELLRDRIGELERAKTAGAQDAIAVSIPSAEDEPETGGAICSPD